MRGPAASIVVATRDRPEALDRCLRALGAQDAGGGHEIVVVDDGSIEAQRVETVAERHAARLIRIAPSGVAAARNRGAAASAAPVVCFLDDDCVAAPGWLACLLARIRMGVDVACGRTVNARPGDPLASAAHVVAHALTSTFALGGNLAVRTHVFRAFPFDESYGFCGAEDRDWSARLLARGYRIEFEQAAVAEHHQQLSVLDFLAKNARYGRGAYRFRRAHRDGRLEPPGFYLQLFRAGFREGAGSGLAVVLAELATTAGFAAEALSRRVRT